MLIVNPATDEERQQEIVARLRTIIEEGSGTLVGIDEWGKKQLAYEIKKQTEGIYYIVTFTAAAATLFEAERILSITDEVLRFQTIRLKS